MPTEVIMPKFDMDQENGTIATWEKQAGEHVDADDTLLTIETDKIAIDVPAPATGTLVDVRYKIGETVPVTTIIAYILAEGETEADIPADTPSPPASMPEPKPAPAGPPVSAESSVDATPIARKMAAAHGIALEQVPASGNKVTKDDINQFIAQGDAGQRRVQIAATPAARRIAGERGVPLESLSGTGPRGRIQAADIPVSAPGTSPAVQIEGGFTEVPLTGMRRTIANRLTYSYQTAPHITLTVEADMTRALAAHKKLNAFAQKSGDSKLSLTTLIVKVVDWALGRNPYINASFDEEKITLWHDRNIGIATAVEEGLIVPVIKNVQNLSIKGISDELTDLASRAREGSLTMDNITGGTFTISNLGMFGIKEFSAIINPPESAILAVSAIIRKPVVLEDDDIPKGDDIAIRPMMNLTLSADHRVIDGVTASRFLNDLVTGLEGPELLLF